MEQKFFGALTLGGGVLFGLAAMEGINLFNGDETFIPDSTVESTALFATLGLILFGMGVGASYNWRRLGYDKR